MSPMSRRGFLQATGAGLGIGLALDQTGRSAAITPAPLQEFGAGPRNRRPASPSSTRAVGCRSA